MVTGKLFQLDLLQEKSYVLSLQWQWSEMPSIFDHQEICTFRCNRTYTHSLLFSCIPVFPWHKGKEEKLHISLCPYPTVFALCQRGLQGPGVQDLHAWISHLSHEQVHDSASVSVDFNQAQVEKEKKIASCIPRRRLEAIHFPHSKGKKGRNVSET